MKDEKKSTRIILTSKEKSELVIEGVVTVILLILLNLAMYMILVQVVEANQSLEEMIYNIKHAIHNMYDSNLSLSWRIPSLVFMGIADLIVLYWRLIRRYRQMQQRHIISELHYISNGHYDHRIPFKLGGDLGKLIQSINALVDSTVEAIEEERRIEQSKDELITNVSHDIRTPLTSIIGFLGLIEEGNYRTTEELLKYTHTAYSKAKQMKLLVDDLFEYTRVRQTNTPLNIIHFDMDQLLAQLVVDYELETEKSGKTIEYTTTPKPFVMSGDTDKLVRVFDNLISNALKYGQDGSKILIDAKKVKENAIIIVKNDGTPIPKKSLTHIFDRFYRVEESRSQHTGGTGLGLAISQNIIERHGGSITATSEKGWTSFIIKLPLDNDDEKN